MQNRLGPRVELELLEHIADVVLDRALCEHEVSSHFGVRRSFGEQPEDVELGRGQFGRRAGRRGGLGPARRVRTGRP